MERPFRQVDVFTADPFRGNALAVVLDGAGLSSEQMQAFTDWTQLSEATFVLPPTHPEADYCVRIFCPGRELPFAGHPTLGTCHAWLEQGGRPRGALITQECGIGLVKIRREGQRLAFAAPPLTRSGPLTSAHVAVLARGLRVPPADILAHAWCVNGPQWSAVLLRSAEAVLTLQPDPAVLAGLDVGVIGPYAPGGPADFEVRAFFPGILGMQEDSVTGSLNAALAQWLMAEQIAPARYCVSQGTVIGRAGRVYLERDGDGTIWVGGQSVTCVSGTVAI